MLTLYAVKIYFKVEWFENKFIQIIGIIVQTYSNWAVKENNYYIPMIYYHIIHITQIRIK